VQLLKWIVIASVMASLAHGSVIGDQNLSGELRLGSIHVKSDAEETPANYATALAGQLKVETPTYHGFMLGAALYFSQDLSPLSGDADAGKFNDELSSASGEYGVLAEAYVTYRHGALQLRLGRQRIDTPYADSDDIRMTPNSFEGIMMTQKLGPWALAGGYLTRWQGPDAQAYRFVDLLESGDGVAMLSAGYGTDRLEANFWYYGLLDVADVFYGNLSMAQSYAGGLESHAALQYVRQKECNSSGIKATLYGVDMGLDYRGATLGLAYNYLDIEDGYGYFGGFGGGVGFVNMDETTAGAELIGERGGRFKVMGEYDFGAVGLEGLSVGYHYGEFLGHGMTGKVVEHNLILSYAPRQQWALEAIYAALDDRRSAVDRADSQVPEEQGFERLLVRANYQF
jgi:imipenem/basic amino acid-specific outer membrane pore